MFFSGGFSISFLDFITSCMLISFSIFSTMVNFDYIKTVTVWAKMLFYKY